MAFEGTLLYLLQGNGPKSYPFANGLESLESLASPTSLFTRNCLVSSPHISIMHISNYCSSKLYEDVPFMDPHQSAPKAHDPPINIQKLTQCAFLGTLT